MSDTPDYFQGVLQRTLQAFVEAGAVEGSGGGMVNLDEAARAVFAALAILAAQGGVLETPRDRRLFADDCAKLLKRALDGAAKASAAGEIDWSVQPITAPSGPN